MFFPKVSYSFLSQAIATVSALGIPFFVAFHDRANGETLCQGPGISLSREYDYLYLQGSICPGDGNKFLNYMLQYGAAVRLIRLNNTGGRGVDAIQIGRYIRSHGISTWTDGREDVCASACNRIFAAGRRRFYSHAKWITTGKQPGFFHGLGYHYPRTDGIRDLGNPYYRAVIVPYLTEMLPPRASYWIIQTDEANLSGEMVWLNGAEALRLGIATSLKVPPSN